MTLQERIPPFTLPKRIETDRLVLKKMKVSDAEEYYYLEKNSHEEHLRPFSPPKESAASDTEGINRMKQTLVYAEDQWDADHDYRFFITLKDRHTIIGQAGITNIIRGVSQSAFIGYWIGKEFIGNGYAVEAVRALLHFAFRELRLHRLSLWISVDNHASRRVAEKLGLRFEGTAQRALYLGDKWHDTDIFAITEEEYES
jgi:ribosomal-protein-alanine N-acetyltransferase